MWRNGRRNGLKIRFREIEVWVRVPPSAPSETAFYEVKQTLDRSKLVAQGDAKKRIKRQSIRQLSANRGGR